MASLSCKTENTLNTLLESKMQKTYYRLLCILRHEIKSIYEHLTETLRELPESLYQGMLK